MRVVCTVLAAGLSRRLGRPKQLLDYRGEPLLRHAARLALGAACDETLVVVPAGQFTELLHDLPVRVLENEQSEEGVSASIRLAVQSARGARILFTLVDQPLVTPEHLRRLVRKGALIAATGYSGTAGVPAIFAPEFAPELLALTGDRGARSVIDAHRELVSVVDFEDAAVDIDREEDVEKLS